MCHGCPGLLRILCAIVSLDITFDDIPAVFVAANVLVLCVDLRICGAIVINMLGDFLFLGQPGARWSGPVGPQV